MREQSRNPNGALRPANKYSYQNIFLFLQLKKAVEKNKKITCKVLMGSRSLPKNDEIVSATAYEKPPPPPPEKGK